MQNELRKHIVRIYKTMKKPKNSFSDKLREIIIEVFIIVIAITLSIWLDNWSEHRKQQKEVKEFLVDLKDDLNKDVESMNNKKETLTKAVQEYSSMESQSLNSEQLEKQKPKIHFSIFLITKTTNYGNYEGFKSSGKIGFIENKKLKKLMLEYFEKNVSSANMAVELYNSQLNKLWDFALENGDKMDKAILSSKARRLFNFTIKVANGTIKEYDENKKLAKELISEIDKVTKE